MTPDRIGRGVTTETATLTIDVVTQALQSDEKLWLSIALFREIREMPEAVRLHRRTQLPQPRAGVLPPIGISADAITMACDAYAQQLTEQAEPNPESIALQTLGYASPLGVRTRLANFLIEAFSPAPVGQSAQAASVSRAPLMVPQQPSPAYDDSSGYDDYPYDQWGLRPQYLRQRRPGFALVSRLLQIAGFIAGLLLLYYMLGG